MRLDDVLKSIKERPTPDLQAWIGLMDYLKAANIDRAILACTDLNVVVKQTASPLPSPLDRLSSLPCGGRCAEMAAPLNIKYENRCQPAF